MTYSDSTARALRRIMALCFMLPLVLNPPSVTADEYAADAEGSEEASRWAGLSLDELKEALVETRSELVSVRRERQQLRYELEQNDEGARMLIAEMNELRRRLQEMNQELNAHINADERFSRTASKEHAAITRLHEIEKELVQRRQVSEPEE